MRPSTRLISSQKRDAHLFTRLAMKYFQPVQILKTKVTDIILLNINDGCNFMEMPQHEFFPQSRIVRSKYSVHD